MGTDGVMTSCLAVVECIQLAVHKFKDWLSQFMSSLSFFLSFYITIQFLYQEQMWIKLKFYNGIDAKCIVFILKVTPCVALAQNVPVTE